MARVIPMNILRFIILSGNKLFTNFSISVNISMGNSILFTQPILLRFLLIVGLQATVENQDPLTKYTLQLTLSNDNYCE